MRYVSLCAGVGGLDRALDQVGGECLVQVEIEPYCRSILDLRWPGVPKYDDLRTFHYWNDPLTAALRGLPVDLVAGGIPCQPISHAGRRKGADDPRWLWPDALRVVREAQPARVFFENPMGLRTLGLDVILAELSGMGYGGAWEVVAAADVGAPHLRKRIFIMGIRGRSGWEGPTRPPGNRGILWPTPNARGGTGYMSGSNRDTWRPTLSGAVQMSPTGAPPKITADEYRGRGRKAAALWPSPNASGERPNEGNVRLLRQRVLDGTLTEDEAAGTGGPGTSPKREGGLNLRTYVDKWPTPSASLGPHAGLVTPDKAREGGTLVEAVSAREVWPTPTSRDWKDSGDSIANGTVPVNGLLGRAVQPTRERGALSPDWTEWLMGWPIGWTDINCAEPGPVYGWESEPAIPRIGLGIPNRSKRLTAIGNGVVTAQAVFAWQRLEERLG